MYLHDYKVGQEYTLDPISFTKEEIINFAEEFDPRGIHTDEDVAKNSRFGGIIASGFHTLTACWGKWVESKRDEGGFIAGIGMDKVRWFKPVYPDMPLYGTIRIQEVNPSSNGKNGSIRLELIVRNEEDEEVMLINGLTHVSVSPQYK